MKQRNGELPAQFIYTVFAIVMLACIILYFKFFWEDTQTATNTILDNTEQISTDYHDYDITMYDGEQIRGSQVVNYIKKNLGDYAATEAAPIYVSVTTVFSGDSHTNKYVNKEYIQDIKNISEAEHYIKPTAYFYCETIRSKNKVLLGISFIQL